MDADGLLTYKIRAAFDGGEAARIGLTGTAKIYGGRSLLAYSLFRRPLISCAAFWEYRGWQKVICRYCGKI